MTRVLVLGAYGLIGANIARHLLEQGYAVGGLGRDGAAAQRVLPQIDWHLHDLRDLTTPEDWSGILEGYDCIVNCAGALQPGPKDDLDAVHIGAVRALAEAAQEHQRIVQISAAGVSPNASTAFFRTKAAGDAVLMGSRAKVTILRPGLVIAPQAYGGTALLRMLAAVPWVQPIAMGDAPVQTVSVFDVAKAVEQAVRGDLPDKASFDLVEDTAHCLTDVTLAHRKWLGFPAAARVIQMPRWFASIAATASDALGVLGWRSPLRSTAMQVLKDGITGDPAPYRRFGAVRSLPETLGSMQASAADRLAARMGLWMPVSIVFLCLFWLVSGVMGVVSLDAASAVLTAKGWGEGLAKASVLFWSVVDIALAALIVVRRTAAAACIGMVVVTLIYLASATVVTPEMWLDPLGPLVKVFPAMILALITRSLLESR